MERHARPSDYRVRDFGDHEIDADQEETMTTTEPTQENLRVRYDAAPGPTWYPRDEYGANVANGQFRCDSEGWIYVDDMDGFSVLSEDQALMLRAHSDTIG